MIVSVTASLVVRYFVCSSCDIHSLVTSLFQDMGDEEESGERASHYLEHWNVIGVTCGVVIERNCVNWLLSGAHINKGACNSVNGEILTWLLF